MTKFLDKVLSKKFKVKIEHFGECKYTVKYSYSRFIDDWYSLQFWFDQGHPGGTECWSINLWNVNEAEKIAKSLKIIEDIKAYYKKYEEAEKQWKEEEINYWKKFKPYTSKIIK